MIGFCSFSGLSGSYKTVSLVAIFLVSFVVLSPTFIFILLLPSGDTVFGHAFVLDRTPAPSESLEEPPRSVEVFLSEPVDERYSEVKVIGPDGNQVDNQDTHHIDGDQSTLSVTLPEEGLEEGVYTVSTQMLSQIDGHVTDDAFVFGIGESLSLDSASGAIQGSAVAESPVDQLSFPDAIARYPALVGQVAVVGAAFVSLWLWKPFARANLLLNDSLGNLGKGRKQEYSDRKQLRTPARATLSDLGQFKIRMEQRLVKLMLIGAVIIIVADFGMIYALAYSLETGIVEAMATKFGNVWFLRTGISCLLFGLILFVYFKVNKRAKSPRKSNLAEGGGTNPLATDRLLLKRELVAILIVGVLILLTTSLMGHGAAVTSGAQVPITIDFVHNLAASIWIGGVFYLALVLVPKLRQDRNLDTRSKCSILCITIPRFSTLPVVVMGIIVITGPFLLYMLEDDLNMTLASLYGKALLAKLIVAAIMLGLGAYNQRTIHKKALNVLALTQNVVGEQEVLISKSTDSKRLHSSSASSDFYSSDSSNSNSSSGPVRSPNRVTTLLKNILYKIMPKQGENNKQLDQHERFSGTYERKGRRVRGPDHQIGNHPTNNPEIEYRKTVSRFNKSIKTEAVLGILLLGAVAVLTNSGLPASEFQGQSQQSSDEVTEATAIQNLLVTTSGASDGTGGKGTVGGGYSSTQYADNATVQIKLNIEPFSVGNNNFEIEFLDLAGNPIDIRTAEIKLMQTEENIGPIEIQTNKISEGLFTSNASFGLAGQWDLFVEGIRSDDNALNLVATFDLFVKPDLDQIEYSVTQIAMPDNRSQPLYPLFDSSRNSIWVGDTSIGSGRLFEYDIANNEYHEHTINGTNIITTMALDGAENVIWFIDPISKTLGSYDPQVNSSRLYNFPNDRIVPSSVALRSADFPINKNDSLIQNGTATASSNGIESNDSENQLSGSTIWITSPSTGEVLVFDTQLENFTNSISLPTPNSNPLGIAVDSSNGQIWIAEGIGKIANIDPASNLTVQEFNPPAGAREGGSEGDERANDTLISPTALLIDPYSGNIYISEHDGYVVSVFDPVFKTFSEFPTIAEDALPFGMALDKDRNLWVAEHVTSRLAIIDPSSAKVKEVTIPLSSPFVQYLTTDNEGKVWFAAQRGSAIGYITSSVNPLQPSSQSSLSASSSSTSLDDSGRSGAGQTPFTLLFSIGFESLLGPLIAIGVIASAVFYVNSVITLKSCISKVNELEARKINKNK
jgi:putative copper export protein/methionine-rich copper-binding protein CopC/streptogramin lyase